MRRSACLAAALTALAASSARAQNPWRETGLWGAALFSRPAFYGGGLSLAWRDAGRTRLGIAAAAGGEEHAGVAGRIEATWNFLLDPWKRGGNGLYAGGGLALAVAHDGRVHPAVEALLGIESNPAGRRGEFIEAGFGRGARIAIGIRWRTPRGAGG